jgi:Flp pilus assembly CpaE family ATPase
LRRLGASEYFSSPADDEELLRAACDLLGLGGAERLRRGSRIVAVHGVVGGAGAGLTSAGLATLIAAQYGRRSVLVDLMLGNASAGAWLACDRPGELSSLLQTPERIDLALLEQVMQRPSAQLALLDGRSEQQATPSINAATCQHLAEILSQHYRYQVWRSSGLDQTASHSLLQADVVVLIVDGSLNALRNVRELLPWLKEQRPELRTLLVFNATRPDAVLDAEAFAEALGRKVDVALPYRRKLAAQQLDAVPFNLDAHVLHAELDLLASQVLGLPPRKARNWFGAR